jgi:hypothetical protein
LVYNAAGLSTALLPPAGYYVLEAEFINITGAKCPDLTLGLNYGTYPALQYVPAPSTCNGDYSSNPIGIDPGAFGTDNSSVLGIASAQFTDSGRNDLVVASTSQVPFYGMAKLQVLINNSDGHFTDETAQRLPADQGMSSADPPEYVGQTSYWYRWVYTADLASRGCKDIVGWAVHGNSTTSQKSIYLNNCDGSNTFRHPTPAEAPMLPYDLYPVVVGGDTYLVQFEYPLGASVPIHVTAHVYSYKP